MKWPWHCEKEEDSYGIFTTAFDVEIAGEELGRELSPEERSVWKDQISAYDKATELERTRIALKSFASVDAVLEHKPNIVSSTAVSVLIDHSGSLRGQKAIIACLLVEMISDFLERLGVKYEILGFTTVAWKGGQSRKHWLAKGRPKKPGRLNDVLHIRYREASHSSPGAPWEIRHILRSDLLKENIDGEALFWASERLKDLNLESNLVIMISDGAPVDDSTLHENGPRILWSHLEAVIKDLSETPGFALAGIGIDHNVSRYYANSLKVDRLDQMAATLPKFLGNLFD